MTFAEATNMLRTLSAQTGDEMEAAALRLAARKLDDIAAAPEDPEPEEEPEPKMWEVEVTYKFYGTVKVEAVDDDEAIEKAQDRADQELADARTRLNYDHQEAEIGRATEASS